LASPRPAVAQEECRLALLLGMDVSASVDAAEYQLQIEGLAAALIHPSVVEAALSGTGPVALSIYEWSGRFQQDVLVDWTLIRSEADLTHRRTGPARHAQPRGFPHRARLRARLRRDPSERAPPCLFRTVDISGDGQNNDGFPPAAAYEHFPFEGVTVNGLAIGGASRGIEDYYLAEVIHGPGAFVEYARNHDDFEEVMRRKLERELRVVILGELAE
jgi:hypothetical protein